MGAVESFARRGRASERPGCGGQLRDVASAVPYGLPFGLRIIVVTLICKYRPQVFRSKEYGRSSVERTIGHIPTGPPGTSAPTRPTDSTAVSYISERCGSEKRSLRQCNISTPERCCSDSRGCDLVVSHAKAARGGQGTLGSLRRFFSSFLSAGGKKRGRRRQDKVAASQGVRQNRSLSFVGCG